MLTEHYGMNTKKTQKLNAIFYGSNKNKKFEMK